MPAPIETVTAFLAELGKDKAAMYQAFRTYFTPTTVWENVGMAITTGPDEAIALMEQFEAGTGLDTLVVDMLAIAGDGGRILTERVDRIIDAQGVEVMAIRLMGIFEVADGKFTAWRDYFDTVQFASPA